MKWLYLLADTYGSWPMLRDRPLPVEAVVPGVGISLVTSFEDSRLAWEVFRRAEMACRVARGEERRRGERRGSERRLADRRAQQRRATA